MVLVQGNVYLVANRVTHRLRDSTVWNHKQKSASHLRFTQTLLLIASGDTKMPTRQSAPTPPHVKLHYKDTYC